MIFIKIVTPVYENASKVALAGNIQNLMPHFYLTNKCRSVFENEFAYGFAFESNYKTLAKKIAFVQMEVNFWYNFEEMNRYNVVFVIGYSKKSDLNVTIQ